MTPPKSGPNSAAPTTAEVVGGVYNAAGETLVDGQATPLQTDIHGNLLVSVSSGGGGLTNVNIADVNGNPPALANPLPVELSDGTNAVGTAGNPLSVNVISGGGSNASVGLTGTTAPTSATEIGIIVTGNLQGVSAANPLPVSGTVTSDIVGHAGAVLDGTAGVPSVGVVTVQGVSGGTAIPVSGTVTIIDPAVGLNNTTAPTSSIEIGSIDVTGKLQGASSSNPIPVTIAGASGSGGNVLTQDNTPGTMFIFQEILMELRAIRKTLMAVYEESGQGNLAPDLVDDVNRPSSVDYN